MVLTSGTIAWRDEPIMPTNYDNLSGLVALGRRAREAVVTFDWRFSEAGLRGLQRAVYEWGTPIRGRYRVFDARVLAAINTALGEVKSIYVLNEPKGDSVVAEVSCVSDAGTFRLQGRTTFDVIFVYASAGVNPDAAGAVFLGEAAPVLAQAGATLGWDVQRLQDERYVAVRNALYGLRLGYGATSNDASAEPPLEVSVRFQGPFAATNIPACPCLFTDPIASQTGVYLWTMEVNGAERPWYVGQTDRGFGPRMLEHVRGFLSGEYTTFDADALSRGEYRHAEGFEGSWPQNLPSIITNFERTSPHALSIVRRMRFYVAAIAKPHLNRVEGAIGRHYKQRHPMFMLPGLQLPARIPHDTPLRLTLSCERPIEGLPEEIRE